MTAHRLQLVTVHDDGAVVILSWGIPEDEYDHLRSILPEPDTEGLAPADLVDEVTRRFDGRVIG